MTKINGLRHYTDDELRQELTKREIVSMVDLPPDAHECVWADCPFKALREMVVEGVGQTIADGYERDDFKYYVYEAAMVAVYGPNYWVWSNRQKWNK